MKLRCYLPTFQEAGLIYTILNSFISLTIRIRNKTEAGSWLSPGTEFKTAAPLLRSFSTRYGYVGRRCEGFRPKPVLLFVSCHSRNRFGCCKCDVRHEARDKIQRLYLPGHVMRIRRLPCYPYSNTIVAIHTTASGPVIRISR